MLLRFVETRVGELHELVELGRLVGALRNTERERRTGALEPRRGGRDRAATGTRSGSVFGRIIANSSPPMRAGVVAESQRAPEALAEIAQHRVAGLVALFVVDRS